ncbi:MAG: hypothetical protein WCH75_14105 [Candidatus Binatia bacterium]
MQDAYKASADRGSSGLPWLSTKDVEPGGKLPKKDIALLSSFLTGALTDE